MISTCFRPALMAGLLLAGFSGAAFAFDIQVVAKPAKPGVCPAESVLKLQIATQLKKLGHLGMDFPTAEFSEGRLGCQAPALMAAVKLYQKSLKCPETGGLGQLELDHLTGKSTAAPDCGKCVKDGLEVVELIMKQYRAVPLPGLPRFTGGAVGFIGYEFIHDVEPIVPRPTHDELQRRTTEIRPIRSETH